jgi:hypothetical protein
MEWIEAIASVAGFSTLKKINRYSIGTAKVLNLMTHSPKSNPPQLDQSPSTKSEPSASERILCQHCLRTATNGIKCQGRCVADSDY